MSLPDERFEICYLLEPETRSRILPALLTRLQPCPLTGPAGHQRMTSLYFGDPPAGLGEAPARRRLRLRLHEADGRPQRCILEVKHRVGLRSALRQASITLAQAQALTGGLPVDAAPEARAVTAEALALVRGRALRPSCLVACDRIALVGDDGDDGLRVTVDSHLEFRTRDLTLRPHDRRYEGEVLAPGRALLVVKVASAVPAWLTLLMGRSGAPSRSPGKHALAAHAAALFAEPRAPHARVQR